MVEFSSIYIIYIYIYIYIYIDKLISMKNIIFASSDDIQASSRGEISKYSLQFIYIYIYLYIYIYIYKIVTFYFFIMNLIYINIYIYKIHNIMSDSL